MTITSLGHLAIEFMQNNISGGLPLPQPTTLARAVARLVVVLHPYGSSAKSILSAVHDMGWTDVTEADVACAIDHLNTVMPKA